MMTDTDLCLITQQAGTGQYFFPSKLLSALAFARPVLAVADENSELAVALDDGGFGWRTAPGDAAELATALERVAGLEAVDLQERGEAGRRYVERFKSDRVLAEFETVLRTMVPAAGVVTR